jgi:hypothetical protein
LISVVLVGCSRLFFSEQIHRTPSGYSFDNKSKISNDTSPRRMTEVDPLKFDSESQTSLIFRDNQEIKLRYVG